MTFDDCLLEYSGAEGKEPLLKVLNLHSGPKPRSMNLEDRLTSLKKNFKERSKKYVLRSIR